MDITAGTRSSRLAKAQVEEVLHEVRAFHPHVRLIPVFVTTKGDIDKTTPLWKVSQTDFFTHEIDSLQLQKAFRCAIHSAKDLPSPLPKGLVVVALTKGVDPRDSLVLRPGETFSSLPCNAKIGTSSKRREAAIHAIRADLQAVDIRGTIDERLALLNQGAVDGLVVAEAALLRLGATHIHRTLLSHETEKLQGKLAVVAREDDGEMASLFASIDTRGVT